MLCTGSYSVVSATITLTSLGSDDTKRACFEHETAQGVRQYAEGMARMLADSALVVAPLAPMFVLPFAGMVATHVHLWHLLLFFLSVDLSYTAVGYASVMFAGMSSAIAS